MIRIILYISVLLFAFIACDSPMQVNANRQYGDIKSYGNISVSSSTIDFGFVKKSQLYKRTFQIKNHSVYEIKIKEILGTVANFKISKPKLPVILKGAKSNSSNQEFFDIEFKSEKLGLMEDILSINNIKDPKIKVKALVPAVYVEDIDIGYFKFKKTIDTSITIINYSEYPAFITGVKNSNENITVHENFEQTVTLEAYSKGKNTFNVPISISFTDQGNFTFHVYFDITTQSNEGLKLNSSITANPF